MSAGSDLDQLIDAQQELFQAELRSKALEIEKARVELAAYQSWYSDNTAQIAYDSVFEGTTFDRPTIESSITINEDDYNLDNGNKFDDDLDAIMQDRPSGFGKVFAWATGNKDVFLETLKTDGQALVDKAQAELAGLQIQLSQLKDEKWQRLEDKAAFYSDIDRDYYDPLVQAVTAEDMNGVLEVIRNDKAKSIPASIKRDLLLRPLNQYDNALLAIADIDLDDPKQE